jgi:hypothetical protein
VVFVLLFRVAEREFHLLGVFAPNVAKQKPILANRAAYHLGEAQSGANRVARILFVRIIR